MLYYWLWDKIACSTFNITWESAMNNWADNFTKHFSGKYQKKFTKIKYDLDAMQSSPVKVCYYSTSVTCENDTHIHANESFSDI